MTEDQAAALAVLDERVQTMLPEEYHDCYEDVQPVSMGSAALKLDASGKVAWDEMWATFCDLAMAGGPPHKGTLLEPASEAAVGAEPDRYQEVVDEVGRGIGLATGLETKASEAAGWIAVGCDTETMAEWLVRAVVMENVAARRRELWLELPAGPAFRLEKEIKNVVTVVAKTSHYWLEHMPLGQQSAIRELLGSLAVTSPLLTPATWSGDGAVDDGQTAARLADRIQSQVGLRPSDRRYPGWLGLECPSVRAAVWLMRALVVSNVLARREGTTLFVPVDPQHDENRLVDTFALLHGLAAVRGAL
jgi:hypothetical protein